MKKLLIYIVSAFIFVIVSIIIFFNWVKIDANSTDNIYSVFPLDPFCIITINNFYNLSFELQSNNQVWSVLKEFPPFSRADTIIQFGNKLSSQSPAIKQLFLNNPVYFSLYHSGIRDINFLMATRIPASIKKKDVKEFFSGYSQGEIIKEENNVTGNIITCIYNSTAPNKKFYFLLLDRLVIGSSSKNLLEASINHKEGNTNIGNNTSFRKTLETAGKNVSANLFINHYRFAPVLSNLLDSGRVNKNETLSDIAEWSGFDISFKKDIVSLTGVTILSDTIHAFLNVMASQKPLESKITSILPSQTAMFVWLGISDLDRYLEKYRSYLGSANQIGAYTSNLSRIRTDSGIDLHELYKSIFDNELALVYIPYDGEDFSKCWFVVAGIKSRSYTNQLLNQNIDLYSKKHNQKKSTFTTIIKIDKETTVEVNRLPILNLHKHLFGNLFADVSDSYYTLLDNYLVFGNSVDLLEKFVLDNIHNNQLNLDLSYSQLDEIIASSSNYFIYLNPSKTDYLFDKYLTNDVLALIRSKQSFLNKIPGITLQLSENNKLIFNSISLKYDPLIHEDFHALWETKLETSTSMKPQILVNHYTKKNEIFTQDDNHNIYLINEVGRILWKKKIDGPILEGEVKQVDIYKNNKLQIAFNTTQFLYIIDRNGNAVDGFPVRFKSMATNPVATFDYEHTRDYRFFVSCSDNKIYAFDNKGKPVRGWSFQKTERTVQDKLQHFRLAGKDYIVFNDANRIYIVDRKGKERVKFTRYFPISPYSNIILEGATKKNSYRFTTTDSLGIVHYLYLDGTVQNLVLKPFSSKHRFDFQDVNADGEKDFIYLDQNVLSVYKQNKELIFSYKFNDRVTSKVIYYNFGGSNRQLGVTLKKENKIYLIKGNGSLEDGFPLTGSTLFSICKFDSNQHGFNLIVGSPEGSVLNYEVK